jgi:hypothetical protein
MVRITCYRHGVAQASSKQKSSDVLFAVKYNAVTYMMNASSHVIPARSPPILGLFGDKSESDLGALGICSVHAPLSE